MGGRIVLAVLPRHTLGRSSSQGAWVLLLQPGGQPLCSAFPLPGLCLSLRGFEGGVGTVGICC